VGLKIFHLSAFKFQKFVGGSGGGGQKIDKGAERKIHPLSFSPRHATKHSVVPIISRATFIIFVSLSSSPSSQCCTEREMEKFPSSSYFSFTAPRCDIILNCLFRSLRSLSEKRRKKISYLLLMNEAAE
jgi:hypothetical protein